MKFIEGTHRNQTYFATLDDQVSADNAVRLMDAFIDKLDLARLGFTNTVHKSEGRPPYEVAVLLNLYLYGYLNNIRTNRKLPSLLVPQLPVSNLNHFPIPLAPVWFSTNGVIPPLLIT